MIDKNALWTYKETAENYHLGLNTTMRLAKESGALVKIGRIARVQPDVFHDYVVTHYQYQA